MPAGSSTASASTTSSRAARRVPMWPGVRTRWRIACGGAASPSTRWAAPCSSRRSSTSAMTPTTRYRRPASNASTRAATTRSMTTAEMPRRWAWPALGALLIGALGLRLWGLRQGLPYAYNTDEADHFVPRAVAMFAQHTLNPHYFANPPAFTYLLHYL